MTETTHGITLAEANLRIAQLCKLPVLPVTEHENLDLPLDSDIQVSAEGWAHKVALIVDGQAVSWCWVVDFQQQIEAQVVRMGGIAGVGTHDQYCFRGYSRRVMTNAVRWMRQAGFDVSMLYGISGYYPKYGYAVAFPGIMHTLAVRDAELVKRGRCRIVDFTPGYLGDVLAMYHETNTERTGITRRDPRQWTGFRRGLNWGSQVIAKVAINTRGRAVGYYVADAAQVNAILEVGAVTPDVYGDLLGAITEQAWAARHESIHFHLPEDDLFMRCCQSLGVRKEVTYRRDGGAMIRLINLTSTLRKLTPVLATRVRGYGSLTIHTNLDNLNLTWSSGEITFSEARESSQWVELPQWALAQLIYGYHGGDSPALAGIIQGSKRGKTALVKLFPQGAHYQYIGDAF